MSFERQDKKDKEAGYKFGCMVKKHFIPILFDLSEVSNKSYADELRCSFIDKNSKTFPQDLRKYL